MDISVIIVNYNTKDNLGNCLRSVLKAFVESQLSYEIFVVDNNSNDGSSRRIKREFSSVNLIENQENVGFSKANNQAIRIAKGRYVLLLNPDTVVMPKYLDLMISFIERHQEIGILGPKLINSKGLPQVSIDKFPTPLTVFLRFCVPRIVSTGLKKFIDSTNLKNFLGNQVKSYFTFDNIKFPIEVDMVSGACMLVRREIIKQVGLLDEKFFLYSEDVDLCFRIKKAGWKIVYFPQAKIIHHGGRSSGGDFNPFPLLQGMKSKHCYFKKHHKGISNFLVKLLLSFALIVRAPWFLYHCIFKKQNKNLNLWKAYQATLMNIITGRYEK